MPPRPVAAKLEAMDLPRLLPWMLRSDWRAETRPFLCVDMAQWPVETPLAPLPPLPLIGLGPVAHPLAARVDMVEDAAISLEAIVTGIGRMPAASAVLVDLLRAIDGVDADAALTMESLTYATLQAGPEHRHWLDSRASAPPHPAGHLIVRREGDRLDIGLDRPSARNAIDRDLRDALFDAFTLAAIDDDIGRVQLYATGRCFSMGADLGEFGTVADPVEAHRIRGRTLPVRAILRCADRLEAHVQGGCVGAGLEMAAFARRFTASPDAWFQLPEIAMGILPGAGGTVSVPRRVGRQRAASLMLSGRPIRARTALDWGLIDAIVDHPTVDYGQAHEAGG